MPCVLTPSILATDTLTPCRLAPVATTPGGYAGAWHRAICPHSAELSAGDRKRGTRPRPVNSRRGRATQRLGVCFAARFLPPSYLTEILHCTTTVRVLVSFGCAYSHSMVPGGFEVTSSTTRLTSLTSLVMRVEIFSSTSYGRRVQSAVMASSEETGRRTIGWP